jgi:DNA-binding NarL/FixJ family response regulator
MNVLTLTISNTPIKQDDDGRYCLNDLHKASGSHQKHRPKYWLENQQTKDLITEIEKGGIPPIYTKQQLGTFVVKELVYAYAMWISPSFSLKVIRTFDSLVTGQLQPTLAHETFKLSFTPEELEDLVTSRVNESSISLQNKYIALLESENNRLKNQPVPASAQTSFGAIRAWTPEEDALVRTLKAQGLGNTRIGLKLGRTENSIRCHLHYMEKRQGGTQ